MSGLISLGILMSVLLLAGGYAISTYNRLIDVQQLVDSQWDRMDLALKQKSRSIPELLDLAGDGGFHERVLLNRVRDALEDYRKARYPADGIRAASELVQAMEHFLSAADQYPSLRANGRFQELRRSYQHREKGDLRPFFNETVGHYNRLVSTFPSSLVAELFRFETWPVFR